MKPNSVVRKIIHLGPEKALADPELQEFIESMTGSVDIWDGLINGYIDPQAILENQDDIDTVHRAVETIKELDDIVRQVTPEV